MGLAGEVEIAVDNTYGDVEVNFNSSPTVKQIHMDRYVWQCARGTTQWTGGERVRELTAQYHLVGHCWLRINDLESTGALIQQLANQDREDVV